MSSTKPSDIVVAILNKVNEGILNENGLKMKFNELSTKGKSICATVTNCTEEPKDVTGGTIEGVLNMSFVYRIVASSIEGSKDLESSGFLDSVFYELKRKYKEISLNHAKIDVVSLVSSSKINGVYQGGIRDFKLSFRVKYTRLE